MLELKLIHVDKRVPDVYMSVSLIAFSSFNDMTFNIKTFNGSGDCKLEQSES